MQHLSTASFGYASVFGRNVVHLNHKAVVSLFCCNESPSLSSLRYRAIYLAAWLVAGSTFC